jgi:signal peptidase
VHPTTQRRTAAEAAVRLELVLLAPLLVALLGGAVALGGLWLVLVGPVALLLAFHARLVVRVGVRSWLPALGTGMLVCAGLAVVLLVVGPVLGLYRTVTVLSGSMRPTFSPGDMVVVSPEPLTSVRVGQVISFRTPTADPYVETHRVIAVLRGGAEPIVQTKGDANNTVDPWRAQLDGSTAWRYRFRLPMLGYPILFLREPWVRRFSVFFLPALLALWALAKLWLPVKPRVVERA